MYAFIINPISGNGRSTYIWQNIKKTLLKKQTKYVAYFTEHKGHATEIVSSLDPQKISVVVVVGGDGTVHDVVNGLQQVRIPIGIIPAGSGNDYARSIQVPKSYRLALERILSGEKKKIDILHVGERFCITVVGIGFDGKVAEIANQTKYKKFLNRLRLGKFTYFFIVLRLLFQYRPTQVTIKLDGQTYQYENVWLIAVANLPYYGGGMHICPHAQSDDGVLDICLVHNISKYKLLQIFPKVFHGKHINHSAITILKGKNVKVYSDKPVVIHGDGEVIGQTPIEVTIKKDVLDIV